MAAAVGRVMRMHLGLRLGLVVVGSFAMLACSGGDGAAIRRSGGGDTTTPGGDDTATPAGDGSGPSAAACPATVPEARAISAQDTSATDLRIVNGSVFYQAGTKVMKVDLKAGTRTDLYASPDLVHSFADDAVLVTIESPNPPDAVIKVMPVGAPSSGPDKPLGGLAVAPPGWNAGGTYVFATDATSIYVLADVANQGDTLYRLNKANPSLMSALARLDAPLGDPQLAGTDVWFVREQKRVYKVPQAASAGGTQAGDKPEEQGGAAAPPVEVFGIGYADCKLAVGGSHAFCSTGTALERRDLNGGNLTTVLDAQKGTAPGLLGAALFGADTVFVRSLPSSPSDARKHGIRAVKTTGATPEESLVACGREPITAVAVDATTVVWTEQGKGVFAATR